MFYFWKLSHMEEYMKKTLFKDIAVYWRGSPTSAFKASSLSWHLSSSFLWHWGLGAKNLNFKSLDDLTSLSFLLFLPPPLSAAKRVHSSNRSLLSVCERMHVVMAVGLGLDGWLGSCSRPGSASYVTMELFFSLCFNLSSHQIIFLCP